MAAALLLAVPVGVAAAIGFEGSLSGLGEGLGALAGPDGAQTSRQPDDRGADPFDDALAAIAASTGSPAPTPSAPGGGPGEGGPGEGGGDEGGGAAPEVPAGPGSPGPAPGGGEGGGQGGDGGGAGGGINPPDVTLPNVNPVGDVVGETVKVVLPKP